VGGEVAFGHGWVVDCELLGGCCDATQGRVPSEWTNHTRSGWRSLSLQGLSVALK
jgi:hypothetical protein